MDLATLVPAGTAAVVVVVVAVAAVVLAAVALLVVLRDRRRVEQELASSRADLAALRARVDGLSRAVPGPTPEADGQEFLITSMSPDAVPGPAREVAVPVGVEPLTAGLFASVAAGESAVRLVSLGHGVRRALSAESRNRIGFAMRQEVRRARRQRRHDLKEAKRHLRAHPGPGLREDAA